MTAPDLPPPPPLAPPEGYVGYSPTNWGTGLRRVNGLAKAIVIVLAVIAVGTAINVATTGAAADAAVTFLESQRTDADVDAFNEDFAVNGLTLALTRFASLAAAILSVIWLFRIAANHRSLGRQLTWAPGWAIGGWFLPPVLFIIPLLMLRESWKASAADVAPGSPEWKQKGESPLLWVWFVLFSVAPIVLTAISGGDLWTLGGETEDVAEFVDDLQGLIIAQGIITILAAIAWALVVRDITRRHAELSGESTGR